MKLCNKCGKQLNDNSSFCDSCGNNNLTNCNDLIFEYNGKKINLTNIIKIYDAKSAAKLISEELCIPKILSDKIVKSAVKGKIEYIDDSIVKKYKILNRFVSISKWVSLSFLTLFTLSIIFGKNSKKPKKIGSSSETSSSQDSKNQESTNEFKVGDIISFDDKEVTVTNVARNYNTGNEFSKPKDGKEFVKVTVEIKNKSKSDISYNTFDFKIKTDNGVLESTSWSASPDDSLGSGKLAENGKIKGSMVFEVPKGDKKLSLRYSPSFWSNKNIEIKL